MLRVLLGRGEAHVLDADRFLFDGRPYRGSFTVLPDGSVVETVAVDDYLYGVVGREMPPRWPTPALEAQAVCARTFVLRRSDPRRSYDLRPTPADQAYGGILAENPAVVAAVDATRGEVLGYGPDYALTVYSSCCGGHTESAADAWGGAGAPYLQGVPCPYCAESPYYRWQRSVPLDVIAQRVGALADPCGTLIGLRPQGRDASGRIRAFQLVGDRSTVTIPAERMRSAMGSRLLPSLLVFSVESQASRTVRIEGGGYGHGVGLCQWGARGLASAGATASEILDYYFPGTRREHD